MSNSTEAVEGAFRGLAGLVNGGEAGRLETHVSSTMIAPYAVAIFPECTFLIGLTPDSIQILHDLNIRIGGYKYGAPALRIVEGEVVECVPVPAEARDEISTALGFGIPQFNDLPQSASQPLFILGPAGEILV